MYEDLQKMLAKDPVLVEGGNVIGLNHKGEVVIFSGSSTEPDKLVDPEDETNLMFLLGLVTNGVPLRANEEKNPMPHFEVLLEHPVVSKYSQVDGEPETSEPTEIAKVLYGQDKKLGISLVLLTGFGSGSIGVLTPVSDAEGNVNASVIHDLMAYAHALTEMADKMSQLLFNEPLFEDEELSKGTNTALFSAVGRAEA